MCAREVPPLRTVKTRRPLISTEHDPSSAQSYHPPKHPPFATHFWCENLLAEVKLAELPCRVHLRNNWTGFPKTLHFTWIHHRYLGFRKEARFDYSITQAKPFWEERLSNTLTTEKWRTQNKVCPRRPSFVLGENRRKTDGNVHPFEQLSCENIPWLCHGYKLVYFI